MYLTRKFTLFAALLCLLQACNSPQKSRLEEATQKNDSENQIETLAVIGTNDIHGTLAPLSLKTTDLDGSQIEYEAAGAATLASYIRVIRSEFGDHSIWLDAGDEFQGSVESNLSQGAPMVEFLNLNHLNASAVGNHEFDFGLSTLKTRTGEANYPYLAANVFEKANGLPVALPNTYPHQIITAGKLKVGVIGLSTLETPVTTRAENVRTLRFDDLKITTLKEAQTLRQMGADLVLIVAHAGLKCDRGQLPTSRMMRKPSDPQGECGSQDEIVRLLRSLPLGTVDAVVSGHSHQVVHHWVAGVPVIQGGAFGRYINIIYLNYDWNQKKILTERTLIEGPIPICSKVFKNQNDCNGDRPAPKTGRGPLISPKFHGEIIQIDEKTNGLLTPILMKSERAKAQILGTAVQAIDHPYGAESALGNLVSDAIRHAVKADVALVNTGGIRAPFKAGPITFGDVFRSLPFDNAIVTLQVTGKELTTILRVAESGSRGLSSVSGVNLRLIDPALHAPLDDLNGDGLSSPWKVNRLIEVTLSSGLPLDPQKTYTLATSDFLVTGGDDLGWAISQISADRIKISSGLMIRDVLISYLQASGPLNPLQSPLVDLKHPRLKLETPPPNTPNRITGTKRHGRSRHLKPILRHPSL